MITLPSLLIFYRKKICMAHNVFIMCEKERDGE
jgi:hypothetical protein